MLNQKTLVESCELSYSGIRSKVIDRAGNVPHWGLWGGGIIEDRPPITVPSYKFYDITSLVGGRLSSTVPRSTSKLLLGSTTVIS